MEKEIGEIAGRIWQVLGENEKVPLHRLPKLVDEDHDRAMMAVGWLARENKLKFENAGKTVTVQLTFQELDSYKKTSENRVGAPR